MLLDYDRPVAEALVMVHTLNIMMKVGMPESVHTA